MFKFLVKDLPRLPLSTPCVTNSFISPHKMTTGNRWHRMLVVQGGRGGRVLSDCRSEQKPGVKLRRTSHGARQDVRVHSADCQRQPIGVVEHQRRSNEWRSSTGKWELYFGILFEIRFGQGLPIALW